MSRPRAHPIDPFGIVGTVIDGRYRIEAFAGEGGFGVVYRALHLGFDSPIAVKVLKLPSEWSPEKCRARVSAFQREGKLLFELSALHPSILRAFETGTLTLKDSSLSPYLALEWLDGVSLAHESSFRRQRGLPPMSLEAVLTLLHGPATALGLAHDHGIIHRDIKPQNLFASSNRAERVVKILDFGIAKMVEEAPDSASPVSAEASVTSAFTPMYAAPEQWLRQLGPTGRATDVHSFALVCVELLTGHLPLQGQSSEELKAACLETQARPTPGRYGLYLHEDVEAVFAKALALSPRERYPDMRVFWSALCSAAKFAPAARSNSVESLAEVVSIDAEPEAQVPATWTALTNPLTSPTTRKSLTRALSETMTKQPRRLLATLGATAVLALGVALALRAPVSLGVPTENPLNDRPADAAGAQLGTNPKPTDSGESADSKQTELPPRSPGDAVPVSANAVFVPAKVTQRASVPSRVAEPFTLESAEDLLSGGRTRQACERAEAVLRRAPGSASSLEFLGRCYMRLGQKERAFSFYRRYLAAVPNGRNAVFVRAMLESDGQ